MRLLSIGKAFFAFIATPLISLAGVRAAPVESRTAFVSYDQIILFGDSITQGSSEQSKGFAFAPALQHGNREPPPPFFFFLEIYMYIHLL